MFKELNILRIFFEEPSREFNVREVARILKIAPATASKDLKHFSSKGILAKRKERILDLYKANLDSELYKDIKIYYNIRKLKDSGFIEYLNEFYLKPAIVLFGSSALGTDTETSDFDILVVSEKSKDIKNLEKYEQKIKKEVQIFAVKDIKDLKNPHLINSAINGIKLQGNIKWT